MTAGGNSGNVELGPGRLYVAILGTGEPASASGALPSAWRAVGYTETGSQFSTNITNSAVEVAEEVDPILYVLSKRENTLAVTMAELTRQNLALALSNATQAVAANSTTPFEPPDPGTETAVMLAWDKLDPADPNFVLNNIRWLFRQGKPGGTITIPRAKSPTKATLAVTFSLEKPAGLAPWKAYPNSAGLI